MKGEVVPESKRDRAPGDEVRSSRSHWIVPLAQGLLVVVMALAGAELAARVTDYVRFRTPLLASPDQRSDLIVTDSLGTRGRPYGQYKGYHLDGAGFRGPDVSAHPAPGCVRIVVLGASETFGSPDQPPYPAELADSLQRDGGCHEVVNAAVIGVDLAGIVGMWEGWVSPFRPQIVIVYPSPVFYLSDRAPHYRHGSSRRPVPDPSDSRPGVSSRFVEKLRDRFEVPGPIQRWRVRRWIAAAVQGRDSSWFFRTVPADRVAAFRGHLDSLVTSIRNHGAEPILVTHAMRFTIPPAPEDAELLVAWRRFAPRATGPTILEFERAAADQVRDVARSRGALLADAAAVLNGRRELFVDFAHFTPAGAARLAGLLARVVRQVERQRLGAGAIRPPGSELEVEKR